MRLFVSPSQIYLRNGLFRNPYEPNRNSIGKAKPGSVIFLGIVFLILGLFLVISGYQTNKEKKEKEQTFVPTEATVVNYYKDRNQVYAIIVSYQVNGKEYYATSDYYTQDPPPRKSKVNVKYNPEDPSDALFESKHNDFLSLSLGIVFTIVGIFLFYQGVKAKKQNLSYVE